MKSIHRSLAFVYGFFLIYFVCIWMGGFMAARQVPIEYFRFFATYGPNGKEAGLAVLGVLLNAFPTFGVLGLGICMTTRLASRDRRAIGLVTIAGCVAGYSFWIIYYAVLVSGETWTASTALAPWLPAPWWAWPQIIAPFLTLGVAYVFVSNDPLRHTEA